MKQQTYGEFMKSNPKIPQITPVEWLALRYHHRQGYLSQDDIAQSKQMEKENLIGFYRWMIENDTELKAEENFGHSDEDMLSKYLNR